MQFPLRCSIRLSLAQPELKRLPLGTHQHGLQDARSLPEQPPLFRQVYFLFGLTAAPKVVPPSIALASLICRAKARSRSKGAEPLDLINLP